MNDELRCWRTGETKPLNVEDLERLWTDLQTWEPPPNYRWFKCAVCGCAGMCAYDAGFCSFPCPKCGDEAVK